MLCRGLCHFYITLVQSLLAMCELQPPNSQSLSQMIFLQPNCPKKKASTSFLLLVFIAFFATFQISQHETFLFTTFSHPLTAVTAPSPAAAAMASSPRVMATPWQSPSWHSCGDARRWRRCCARRSAAGDLVGQLGWLKTPIVSHSMVY